MQRKTGVLLVLSSFILTCILWLFVEPINSIPIASQYSQLIAVLALVGFAWVNFISTRHSSCV